MSTCSNSIARASLDDYDSVCVVEREKERERQCVCMCVYVCVSENKEVSMR